MDEPPDACGLRSGDHRPRAVDITDDEAGLCRRADDTRDMHDRVGPLDQCGKAVGPIECPLDPGYVVPRALRPAGEGAHAMAGGQRPLDQRPADEAGRPGNGEGGHACLTHSVTPDLFRGPLVRTGSA